MLYIPLNLATILLEIHVTQTIFGWMDKGKSMHHTNFHSEDIINHQIFMKIHKMSLSGSLKFLNTVLSGSQNKLEKSFIIAAPTLLVPWIYLMVVF